MSAEDQDVGSDDERFEWNPQDKSTTLNAKAPMTKMQNEESSAGQLKLKIKFLADAQVSTAASRQASVKHYQAARAVCLTNMIESSDVSTAVGTVSGVQSAKAGNKRSHSMISSSSSTATGKKRPSVRNRLKKKLSLLKR